MLYSRVRRSIFDDDRLASLKGRPEISKITEFVRSDETMAVALIPVRPDINRIPVRADSAVSCTVDIDGFADKL